MKKLLSLFLFMLFCSAGYSQVTNSGVSGTIKDSKGGTLPGVNIELVHKPSGSKYRATTNGDGYYFIPSIRPGGPYDLKATSVGYNTSEITDIDAPLGKNITVSLVLVSGETTLNEVVVKSSKNGLFSKGKTGASQQFSNREINAVPIIGSRSINDITKYNANGNGSSFGGQDSRLNNFTIDGSMFNNGFGLGNTAQAGGRTGSTAISLDAIEQLQVNIAPFDVRQSGFVGAGINAVTKSGTNEIKGSVYTTFRNNSSTYVGNKAAGTNVIASKFKESIKGVTLGAPIIKNKLFFFGSYETLDKTSPATTWTSTGSPLGGSQVSLPKYTEMEALSQFMETKFGYKTGPWENYDSKNVSDKFLAKIDWNINDNNKLSVRYIYHDSESDQLISNSNSAGNGNRTNQQTAMSFRNSGYTIQDNTRSVVLELNSKISEKFHNVFIGGYDKQLENRGYLGAVFPTIDIRNGGPNAATYISLGMDPFTPGNKLDYATLHFTDNITANFKKHTVVAGVNYEKFKSNNLFFPASNGVYTFNSLADFYTAANQSASANGAPSTFLAPRLQFRYSALPGAVEPLQVLKSNKLDFYLQDEIRVSDKYRITAGVRISKISFEDTALENPTVTALNFANGKHYNTGNMPKNQLLFEPRLGMNLDVFGDETTQLRGGIGIFTGKPPYVFVSNQIGNNGVLTGFIDDGTHGFTPNPNQYFIPAKPTFPSTFDLAFTESNYKFPQVWKIDLAWDQKLPFGFVGSIEGVFNKNINEVFYYNANAKAPIGTFTGADNRPRFARSNAGNWINSNVSMAAVLANSNSGYYEAATFKLEYPSKKGLFGSLAYTISETKDLMSGGSIASGSWTGAKSVNGNNNLTLSLSDNDIPHRVVGLLGYKIKYGDKIGGTTTISLGYVGQQAGRFSYTYSGDMNGDGVSGNDLLFIPNKGSDLRFQSFTVGTTTYSEADQQAAFETFIKQDKYLSSHRGQYMSRNAQILPMLNRIDLSVAQDFNIKFIGKTNSFQVRADILNFGNLLNSDWGVSQRSSTVNPLLFRQTVSATDFTPLYRVNTQVTNGVTTLLKDSFLKNSTVFDVWSAQLTLRYSFN